ncbi:Immunity protein 8 [Terribacillus halophilus]|uniref:Immunity protein 8 n=1 Tax=Terribacillus halophilus TaxID=361279 RepID=A0A1G6L407_9BACI|nr:Imm8 family immunity protein [Terribacillus halophilus]SDC37853.1 Immunity protein 8 [Terribacillus halophilus]
MLEIKSIVKDIEDWGEDADDFIVSFEIDVGEQDIPAASDMLTFSVISPKRLSKVLDKVDIEIGHGYLLMKDFNIRNMQLYLENIMNKCKDEDYDIYLNNLARYFKLHD